MRRLFWVLAFSLSTPQLLADQLTIISPHRKSIQNEFMPLFKAHYKETYGKAVTVDWLDQGGTSDDLRFLRAKFNKNPQSSGIDIFWGGGTAAYTELDRQGYLASYRLTPEQRRQLPKEVSGHPLTTAQETWHASAMSSFGIFYNKRLLSYLKLPAPQTWQDMAGPTYYDQISLADPRRSGSANTMSNIILQNLGWQQGFATLTAIGANTRSFTHSSSDPIKAVVSGDAAMAMAIDFYALAKIGDLGAKNLGFALPPKQTALDPDPIAILKGAPHRKVAERFVDFVLSAKAQKLLVLPKGAADGPKKYTLGRFAVNSQTYATTEGQRINPTNPFKAAGFAPYDAAKAGKLQAILNDLMGALIVDTHRELKAAWHRAQKDGLTPEEIKTLGAVPLTEAEALKLADKWNDNVLRNKTINNWVAFARQKYKVSAH